uniref:CWH43-like N-terminal domain-containing protein n=1 Tax=Meloidogyne incognita TaxID=6306 RepID=A0A914MG80_MELIC
MEGVKLLFNFSFFSGIFWQFTFLFHIPLRIVEIAVGFYRYDRLRLINCNWPKIYNLSRYLYLIFGCFELIFLIALSVVGEREFISYHVVFFYAFGGFATGFFITNVVCHSQSLYYLNPYGRISYYIKIIVTILFIISMPILFGAFILYWRKCITIMYDVFAIAEYIDVFLTISYHCCAFFDIRHKVIFSIRDVKKKIN